MAFKIFINNFIPQIEFICGFFGKHLQSYAAFVRCLCSAASMPHSTAMFRNCATTAHPGSALLSKA
jgi:hypothetical protein